MFYSWWHQYLIKSNELQLNQWCLNVILNSWTHSLLFKWRGRNFASWLLICSNGLKILDFVWEKIYNLHETKYYYSLYWIFMICLKIVYHLYWWLIINFQNKLYLIKVFTFSCWKVSDDDIKLSSFIEYFFYRIMTTITKKCCDPNSFYVLWE